jgi:hypothetical protein
MVMLEVQPTDLGGERPWQGSSQDISKKHVATTMTVLERSPKVVKVTHHNSGSCSQT